MKHLKQCSFCGKKVYKLANPSRGLCANCYYRERRNGSLEYVRKERQPCTVEGCVTLQVAKGYCDKHYRRFVREGTPVSERAENWGHSHGHPLYDRWRWIKQRRNAAMDEGWRDDFWTFVADVGAAPTPRHRLSRIDDALPIGPKNFEWREPKTDIVLVDKRAHADYMRAYRIREPRRFQNIALKKHYGITVEDYERMLAEQGGTCAICRRPERVHSKRKGAVRGLAVDHCHNSKRVRGLLCTHCNAILGQAQDSIDVLRAAIAYLKKN